MTDIKAGDKVRFRQDLEGADPDIYTALAVVSNRTGEWVTIADRPAPPHMQWNTLAEYLEAVK